MSEKTFNRPNLIACGIYAVSCWFLYYVKYRLFGGTVETGFLYALLFPPVCLLVWLVDGKQKAPATGKTVRVLLWFAIIACGAYQLWLLLQDPRNLLPYLYFSIIFVVFLADYAKKRWPRIGEKGYAPMLISIVYSTLVIVSAFFASASGLCTVPRAEALLVEEAGYSAPFLIGAYSQELLKVVQAPDAEAVKEAMGALEKGGGPACYLFRCQREGEVYGAFVSIPDGEFLTAVSTGESSMLKGIIREKARDK